MQSFVGYLSCRSPFYEAFPRLAIRIQFLIPFEPIKYDEVGRELRPWPASSSSRRQLAYIGTIRIVWLNRNVH